ncbi:MAG: HPr family phosphocarrier protein [Deltaproteobacteria bacterium]|nr:MAG: HPr family phosphocarrier protein [Deltaproteobacteria bacterium]
MGRNGQKKKRFTITNKLGIHLRVASLFSQTANQFSSEVQVSKDGLTVSGKSITDLLRLGAASSSRITVTTKGPDASSAMEALEKLIVNKFGEE